MSKKSAVLNLVSLGALTLVWPALAQAQQAQPKPDNGEQADAAKTEKQAQEVVVITARKTAEVLRDVPVAATVIDTQTVADRGGVADAEQLLADVPSVHYAQTSTGLTSEITIRNSGPARGGGSDSAVGLYSNGAYVGGGTNNVGSRNFADIDYFDLGRVEVLRGTQGALYGRNAVGGAVNLISQRPTNKFSVIGDAKYGIENEQTTLQGVVNIPVTELVSTRFGVKRIYQSKGFFHNTYLDRYNDDTDLFTYRGQINLHTDKLEVNFLGERQTANVPALALSLYSPPSPTTGVPYGLYDPPRENTWNYAGAGEQDITMFNLAVDYDLDWASFTSTTMWRKRASHQGYDTDVTNPERRAYEIANNLVCIRAVPNLCSAAGAALRDASRTQDNFDTAESWFADMHLAGKKVGKLSWLLGVEFLQVENGSLLLTSATNPSLTGVPSPTANRTDSSALLDSLAYYGSVGYDLLDDLNITLEARQVNDRRKRHQVQYNAYTLQPTGTRTFVDAASQPDNFSYNATVGYKLFNNWLVYAKVGTAFRAGGFNTDQGDPRQPNPIPPAFGDEHTQTYELGLKGDLTENIYLTAAAYQSKVDDIIVQRDNGCNATNPVCPVGSTLFFTNAGTAEPKGVELELNARWDLFGGKLKANVSGAWLNGKITSGPLAGAKIPQSPEWTAGATINYRRAIAGDLEGFTNLVYSYQAGGVQEIEQTPLLYDHTIVDWRFGVSLREWELSANVTNAFDEDYITFDGPSTKRYNVPRNVTIELRYAG